MYSDSRRRFLKQTGLIVLGSVMIARTETNSESSQSDLKTQVIETFKLNSEQQLLALLALEKEHGSVIRDIADAYSQERMFRVWKKLGEEADVNDIEALVDRLWHGYCKKDGFKYTVLKEGEVTQMDCTYCPHVALYKKYDAADWGYLLLCKTDFPITRGFNENIQFERTRTLMQGDDCCNHSYRLIQHESIAE